MNTYRKISGVWCVACDAEQTPGATVTVTTRKGRQRPAILAERIPVPGFVYRIAIGTGDAAREFNTGNVEGESIFEIVDETAAPTGNGDTPAPLPVTAGDLLVPAEPFTLTAPQERTDKPAKPANRADKAQQVMDLFGELLEARADEAAIRRIVQDELSRAAGVTRIEVKNRSQKLATLQGHFHPNFPLLCRMASSFGTDGYVPGIFIAGEASSGKTYACKMLAAALSLPWHFNGAISQPHEMLGFIDGAGRYHRTPFREAYEHGGVYTFDESDRCDPNALLAVNPHLANGVAEFPDGQIKRHPDCIITCTANTWGMGADAQYVGATKLDAAFLSRFPLKLHWNIDEPFERAIVGNDVWCARVQAARARAKAAGLMVMIDVRCNQAGAAFIEAGATHDEAAAQTYLANLSPEQQRMVEGS